MKTAFTRKLRTDQVQKMFAGFSSETFIYLPHIQKYID